VHAFVVIGGDCAGFDIQFRKDGIDKGGFTYSGMSGEERYFPFEFFFYSVDSLTGFGGYLNRRNLRLSQQRHAHHYFFRDVSRAG
jgi:hypothetical protein